MRRWVLVGWICAGVGCGFSAVGTHELAAEPGVEAGVDGPALTELDSAASADDAAVDALIDAEADRPDAGVVFLPSHIAPVYTLNAADVAITVDSEVDTSARTIKPVGGAAVVSPDIAFSGDGAAVWSVGAFSLASGVRLTVKGSRALVVVAARDVEVRGRVAAFGDQGVPGPGGFGPAMGTGKGGDGAKTGDNAAGGGGAGHATAGGAGADKGGAQGGTAGPIVNAAGALLAGGSGGGNGGGFGGGCSEARRGRGGAGGGAIQISALGKILVASTAGVDVSAGGGAGGCKNSGGNDAYSGGGGGGAGGVLVFESVVGVELEAGAVLAAAGGGGGEGGQNNQFGNSGEEGPFPTGTAAGGTGTNGGNGGNGGAAAGAQATVPLPGASGDSSGGGGGSAGRVFLGTRAPATPIVAGTVGALRTDYAF